MLKSLITAGLIGAPASLSAQGADIFDGDVRLLISDILECVEGVDKTHERILDGQSWFLVGDDIRGG